MKNLTFAAVFFLLLQFWAADSGLAQNKLADQESEIGTRESGIDWPTFLGPKGESVSPEKGILKDWSDGKLKLLWKIPTGDGYGMGSVANGRFYHFGKIDGKATLLCLNAETGKELWKFAYESDYKDLYGYDSGPRASPIIDGQFVYIYGVEGQLYCLNAKTGERVWDVDLNKKFGVIQNFFGVASTPVIFEDMIIVMVGGSPDESKKAPPGALDQVEPNGAGLVALDKKTGELKYKSVNDLASYSSLKLAKINNQDVLLAWMRGSLYGVRPKTGETVFEFPWRSKKLESVNAAMPVVKEDEVFISECYEIGSALLKFEDLKHSVVWSDGRKRTKAMEAHWTTPVLVGGEVFGCSGRHTGTAVLRCINWETGKIHWSVQGLTRTSLTHIDGHLIVLGEKGKLSLVEATKEKYKVVTRYEPGDAGVEFKYPCWAAPIVSHGLMYVRGKETLACFELIPQKAK